MNHRDTEAQRTFKDKSSVSQCLSCESSFNRIGPRTPRRIPRGKGGAISPVHGRKVLRPCLTLHDRGRGARAKRNSTRR